MGTGGALSRRTILQASAITGLFGARQAGATDLIKIGIPVALTGPLGGIGAQMRQACDFWAKQVNEKGGLLGDGIKWNFTKFLVDKQGNVVERYAPTTTPDRIAGDIERELARRA